MTGRITAFCAIIWLMMASTSAYAFQVSGKRSDDGLKKILREQSGKFSSTPGPVVTNLNDQEAEEKPNPWTKSWNLNLTGNQASYRNWSQGGVNSIASTASTLLRIKYSGDRFSNSFRTNLQYGQTWLDGEDSRKTSDLINFRYKLDYFLTSEAYSAFAEVDFRTQFTKGFDDGYTKVISNFMAPGYLTESIGFSYQPKDFFSSQAGIGLKQTFVQVDSLKSIYAVEEEENFRSEGGLTISVKVDTEFGENFNYSSEVNSFTNFLIPISSTDIIFRNELSGKLNSFLSTMIQFELIYDDDIISKAQIRQAIAVGFNIKLM